LQLEEKRKNSRSRTSIPALPEDLRGTLSRYIEMGLDSLGRNMGRVILYHLEIEHSLKVKDIIDRPESFVKALQDMFGDGAFTLEQVVVEAILRNMPAAKESLQTKRFCRLMTGLRQKLDLSVAPEQCIAASGA